VTLKRLRAPETSIRRGSGNSLPRRSSKGASGVLLLRAAPDPSGSAQGIANMSHRCREHDRQGVGVPEIPDVQDLHAAVPTGPRDERITIEPFPLWMLVVIGVIFFFAGFFAARDGSDFTGAAAGLHTSPPAPSVRSVQMRTASTGAVRSTITDHNAPIVAHVSIKNMKFNPPNLEVKKGDTVEWRNDDITPHTATSASFDSGSINPEESWRHTFNDAGNISYACTFHPDMKAALTVK